MRRLNRMAANSRKYTFFPMEYICFTSHLCTVEAHVQYLNNLNLCLKFILQTDLKVFYFIFLIVSTCSKNLNIRFSGALVQKLTFNNNY